MFQKSVPILPIPLAYLIAFLNMVPGKQERVGGGGGRGENVTPVNL